MPTRQTRKVKKVIYEIHDNMDTPFQVEVQGSSVKVFKGLKNEEGGYDNYDEQIMALRATAVYPGKNSCSPSEARFFDCSPQTGNTVLLRIGSKYIYIGGEIFQFSLAANETVVAYYSKIGPNDVPYPVLVGSKNVYILIEKVYVPRSLFDRMDTKEWADASQYYYGYKGKQRPSIKSYAKELQGFKVIRERGT
jgi:hypothetical protein